MSKDLDNQYFIIINKDEIIFSCLNNEDKISFTKNHNLLNGQNNLLEELEKFFNKNLIDIEKNLKDFIKKIYIIIDIDDCLSINLSIKYKLEAEKINEYKINDLLSSLKYQFTKYSNDQKVIHMIVNKLLINGKENDLSQINKTSRDLILEVKFECLKNQIVNNIKKILSNYQISIEKILLANYLREYSNDSSKEIIFLAKKIIHGDNINEVLWAEKKIVKQRFFERFFNFFN
jgi:hypothetical protein